MIYRFVPFELNPRTGELRKSGVRIKLGGQPLEVLTLLVQRQGDLVTREELKDALWKEETFTDFDHGVNTAIQRIRRTLGDSAQTPRFIETFPRKGYRFIATVEQVGADSPIPGGPVPLPPSAESVRNDEPGLVVRRLLLFGPALAVALAVFYGVGPSEREGELPPVELSATPLPGNIANTIGRPAFSPNGEQIAFTWTGPEPTSPPNLDIYVMSLNSGEPLRVSSHPSMDVLPSWSPDGSTLVWWRVLGGGRREIVEASAVGGPERPWGQLGSVSTVQGDPIAWTEDSKHLIFSEGIDGSQSLYVRSRDGERRRLPSPAGGSQYSPALSPDGRLLAFAHRDSSAEEDGIYLLEVTNDGAPVGDPRRINQDRQIWSLSWTADGNALVYQSSRTGRHALWRVPISPAGAPRQRLGTVTDIMGVAVAPAGDRLAFCRSVPAGELYRMAFDENSLTVGEPQRLGTLSGRIFHPHFSPDGRQLVFSENRDLYSAILIADADGDNVRRLYSDPSLIASGPRWAPGGERITFMLTPAMLRDSPADGVYVMSARAARPVRVSGESVLGLLPSWSSGGDAVYFASDRSGRNEIWKQSLGDEATQVTGDGGFQALESPDGRFLYYMKTLKSCWSRASSRPDRSRSMRATRVKYGHSTSKD